MLYLIATTLMIVMGAMSVTAIGDGLRFTTRGRVVMVVLYALFVGLLWGAIGFEQLSEPHFFTEGK